MKTIASLIPGEETVQSVTQEKFFHDFRGFNDTAIYRIIMSKGRSQQHYQQVAMTCMGEKVRLPSNKYFEDYNPNLM
ncbi:MAG: hypothetical protein QGG48_08980 [Desulfatiglandales bacterium]|nr:hypothetical protein [Desulfatiglandales bacterium]